MTDMQEEEDYELQSVDRNEDDEMFEQVDQDQLEEQQEEHEYGTDEDGDKRQYGIYQALPVDDAEPDWESGEAATVEEYLRRVRYEARQLPSIVTSSDIDPRHFDTSNTLPPSGYPQLKIENENECREELKPTLRWVRMFLKKFAILRHRLQREYELETGQVPGLPLKISPSFSLGRKSTSDQLPVDSPSSLMPELAALKGLDQVTIVTKLRRTARNIVGTSDTATAADAAQQSHLSPPSHLPEIAAEMYALSARVERPLHADTAAAFRSLLRKCKIWRGQGIQSPSDPLLPHLNILICIAGGYFRQDEELSAVWDEEVDLEGLEEGHELDDIML